MRDQALMVIDRFAADGSSVSAMRRTLRDKTFQSRVMSISDKARKYQITMHIRAMRIKAARESFWEFCRLLHPDFYKEDRWHLRMFAEALQALYERRLILPDGRIARKLMINCPPRVGKSRTLILFCSWILGKNQEERIIACSYNDKLATDFSRYARDEIRRKRNFETEVVYSDIFPDARIKRDDSSYVRWALEGQHFNYLGAGVGSGITGKGCTFALTDDLVKDASVAFSESDLKKIWQWYTDTFLSRQEDGDDSNTIEVMCGTRWAKKDPCGMTLESEYASDWYRISLEAMDRETGEMLCGSLFSRNAYMRLRSIMTEEIFSANFHQEAVDIKGRMYQTFELYDRAKLTEDGVVWKRVIAYIDTADTGSDRLAGFVAGEYNGNLYILDTIYTPDPMERTEPATADMLFRNKADFAVIESNNGGRGFARNVERILCERGGSRCAINWMHQSKNKAARIYSASAWVQQHVYWPREWSALWPDLFHDLTSYQKEGINKHDDAPDGLTGLAEMIFGEIAQTVTAVSIPGI